MGKRAVVAGVGGYLPKRLVSNAELASTVGTSDDWIVERTGIRSRRIAAKDESTSDMASEAARRALAAPRSRGNSAASRSTFRAAPQRWYAKHASSRKALPMDAYTPPRAR